MEWYFYLLFALIFALAALIAVVLVRTLRFRPKAIQPYSGEAVDFDKEASMRAMQTLVRFKTVSDLDPSQEDEGEFTRLIEALPALYPAVYEKATLTTFPGRALLYHIKGTEDGDTSEDEIKDEQSKKDKKSLFSMFKKKKLKMCHYYRRKNY